MKWLVALVFIFTFVAETSMTQSAQDDSTFKGYSKFERELGDGHIVGSSKTSELTLYWLMPKGSAATSMTFSDLKVTDLSTNKLVCEPVKSPLLSLGERMPIGDGDQRMPAFIWNIAADVQPVQSMTEFVDYSLSATAVFYDTAKREIEKRKVQLNLIRDYQQSPAEANTAANWAPGASSILMKGGSKEANIRYTVWSDKVKRIITVSHFGEFQLVNSELVFQESVGMRKAFYLETANERFEKVDGRLKRIWDSVKKNVDVSSFPYENIYERGYESP